MPVLSGERQVPDRSPAIPGKFTLQVQRWCLVSGRPRPVTGTVSSHPARSRLRHGPPTPSTHSSEQPAARDVDGVQLLTRHGLDRVPPEGRYRAGLAFQNPSVFSEVRRSASSMVALARRWAPLRILPDSPGSSAGLRRATRNPD